MSDFNKPPMRDGGINFPWFNWFRRLYDYVVTLRTDTDANTSALAGKQPLDGDLTAISGVSGTGLLQRDGIDTWSLVTITGAALKSVEYTYDAGTFTWPTNVDLVYVTMIGAGGGGAGARGNNAAYVGGGGGGAGECLYRIPYPRNGVATTLWSCGFGGGGGAGGNTAGGVPGAASNGNASTFGSLTALGGKAAPLPGGSTAVGGAGGGRLGGAGGTAAIGTDSVSEGNFSVGGSGGGGTDNTKGFAGGASENKVGGSPGSASNGSGGGGGSSQFAVGGTGASVGATTPTTPTAATMGSGGGGGAKCTGAGVAGGSGGSGGDGYILVEWVG
jgi:hypothetical protein